MSFASCEDHGACRLPLRARLSRFARPGEFAKPAVGAIVGAALGVSGAVEEASSAEARLQAALAPAGSPVEIAAALEAVGQHNPSRRRRLQAEILRQAFRQAAQLAKACGWNGRVVLAGDDILLDQDQVLLPAEPSHFRGSGPPAIDALARPLETFGIDARIIVDLDAGSGEDALRLARRFPQARVFAGAASAERADAIEAMLALQHTPIPNLELVWPLPRGGGDGKLLAALAREFGFRRFDLLKFDARTWGAGLAPEIAALAGRIACACVEVSAEVAPGDRDELLAAFEAAGMVLLEKRSVPTADARAWLEAHIAERPLVTAWFVEKRLTGSRPSPEVAGLKLSKGAAPSPARPLRARLYEWLCGPKRPASWRSAAAMASSPACSPASSATSWPRTSPARR